MTGSVIDARSTENRMINQTQNKTYTEIHMYASKVSVPLRDSSMGNALGLKVGWRGKFFDLSESACLQTYLSQITVQ